jgi:hypothetical protein
VIDLTILCVSAGAAYGEPFIDDMREVAADLNCRFVLYDGSEARVIEDVLDEAVALCAEGWILRLDDDERVSPEMYRWLLASSWHEADHWAFPRLNLWPDDDHYIRSDPLFPDLQTRLSTKAKSGGRTEIHQGSPFGTGRLAPCAIEHHKFLVRSEEERRALVLHYDAVRDGAGRGFADFSVPEDFPLSIAEYRRAVPA